MTAAFRKDDQVTIERRTAARDPKFNTPMPGAGGWEVVADRIWANVQDVLPSRGESTANGMQTALTRTRLRIGIDERITTAMRVTLHGQGDRVMQIVAGPALLDNRRDVEWMLEGYSHG